MEFKVDTTDIIEGSTRLRRASAVIPAEMTVAMHRSTSDLLGAIVTEAPFKTGRLAHGHHATITAAGGTIKGVVSTDVPYARWVYGGRDGFEAKHAKALRFVIGGVTLFRKRVGPAKANKYLDRALTRARPAILREFALVIPRVAKRIGF